MPKIDERIGGVINYYFWSRLPWSSVDKVVVSLGSAHRIRSGCCRLVVIGSLFASGTRVGDMDIMTMRPAIVVVVPSAFGICPLGLAATTVGSVLFGVQFPFEVGKLLEQSLLILGVVHVLGVWLLRRRIVLGWVRCWRCVAVGVVSGMIVEWCWWRLGWSLYHVIHLCCKMLEVALVGLFNFGKLGVLLGNELVGRLVLVVGSGGDILFYNAAGGLEVAFEVVPGIVAWGIFDALDPCIAGKIEMSSGTDVANADLDEVVVGDVHVALGGIFLVVDKTLEVDGKFFCQIVFLAFNTF